MKKEEIKDIEKKKKSTNIANENVENKEEKNNNKEVSDEELNNIIKKASESRVEQVYQIRPEHLNTHLWKYVSILM